MKHEFATFRAHLAPGEWRFHKPRPAAFHQISRRAHRMRCNSRMSNDNMPWSKRGRHLPEHIQKCVVVRDKNLNVIAHLGELGRCADEIRNGSRVSVPNKNMKALSAEIIGHPAPDNAESDHTNIFSSSTRH